MRGKAIKATQKDRKDVWAKRVKIVGIILVLLWLFQFVPDGLRWLKAQDWMPEQIKQGIKGVIPITEKIAFYSAKIFPWWLALFLILLGIALIVWGVTTVVAILLIAAGGMMLYASYRKRMNTVAPDSEDEKTFFPEVMPDKDSGYWIQDPNTGNA